MPRRVLLFAACFAIGSCRVADPDAVGPVPRQSALELATSSTSQLQSYLAPRTVVRESGSRQTESFPVGGDKYSFFMEPFVLHVHANRAGSAPVVGWVRVDGVQVLGPDDLRQPVADHVLEVPITRSSVVSVELAGAPGGGVTVSMDAAFQPPPTIVLSSPVRGAMLKEGTLGDFPVTLSGEACHERFPITRLEINGTDVPVPGNRLCEPFEVTQASRWGTNVITGSVENTRGRKGTLAQAYLRSPTYFPVATTLDAAARVPGAVVAQLNQAVLDDHNDDLDDIAAILNRGLRDFNMDLPGEVAHDCRPLFTIQHHDLVSVGYQVSHGPLTIASPPRTHLTAVPGGLAFATVFSSPTGSREFQLPVTASVGVEASCPISRFPNGVSGTFTLDGAGADGTGQVEFANGTPHVTIPQLDVGLVGLKADLDVGALSLDVPLDFVVDGALAFYNEFLATSLRTILAEQVSTSIDDVLAQATISPQSARVGDVSLQFAGGLDGMSFAGPAGFGFAALSGYAQVVPLTPGSGRPVPAFGSIQSSGAAPIFSTTAVDLGVGVKDDAVNQLLWAAWEEGAFDLSDVGGFVPSANLNGIQLSLTTHLPPVVMPGSAPAGVEIGLGGMDVEASIDPAVLPGGTAGPLVHARLFVSGFVDAALGYDESTNRIRPGDPTAHFAVEIADIDGFVDESAVSDRIAKAVDSAAVQLMSASFAAFPLPKIDISNIVGLPNSILALHDVTVDRAGNYTRLGGRVSALH